MSLQCAPRRSGGRRLAVGFTRLRIAVKTPGPSSWKSPSGLPNGRRAGRSRFEQVTCTVSVSVSGTVGSKFMSTSVR